MLMEILFGADGLRQLKGSVLVCARLFQLTLTRLVKYMVNTGHYIIMLFACVTELSVCSGHSTSDYLRNYDTQSLN